MPASSSESQLLEAWPASIYGHLREGYLSVPCEWMYRPILTKSAVGGMSTDSASLKSTNGGDRIFFAFWRLTRYWGDLNSIIILLLMTFDIQPKLIILGLPTVFIKLWFCLIIRFIPFCKRRLFIWFIIPLSMPMWLPDIPQLYIGMPSNTLNFSFHYELELLDLQFVHPPYHSLFAIQTCIGSKWGII